jgi:hypothetical protein
MNTASAPLGALAAGADTPSPALALGGVGALAALGVFLLFGHAPGLGAVLFVGAVEAAAVLRAGASPRLAAICALVGAATLAPLVEDANVLSVAIAVFGAGAVATVANGEWRGFLVEMILRMVILLGVGPFNALFDLPDYALRASRGGIGARSLVAWALPLGLGGVFLALFAVANPVIAGWLSALDISSLIAALDFRRIALWLVLVAVVWPFVVFRSPERKGARSDAPVEPEAGRPALQKRLFATLVTPAAILRSLVLFNAMFAVQTALDVAILWGGRGLPEGVSFASYAHRGAYPLVATALLSGALVVLAMRPGADAARSKPIRALVYVWIAQNVALVVSSFYRLDLYVRVYSLTYWRVAAFVWMALVALGLVLIVVQVAGRRSTRWLLTANVVAAAGTIYLTSFADLGYLIADFNLRHCAAVSRGGAVLDLHYLSSLGPDAIPALDEALASSGPLFASPSLSEIKTDLESSLRQSGGDWRSWTFRGWRLSRAFEIGPRS